MTKEEIEDYIKELILSNMTVQVDISPEPYSNNESYNVRVVIEYDGEEISSYGDSIRVSNG
ncbi:hypothetical protein SEPL_228 [Salmonella phage SE_PL]|uniref:hypothetical protein n=1 Tax=Salmonella enterica TaxID=28901 RepID=UPI000FDF6F26|nr:hypothetical protein CPT_Munch_198 [Salmonella phage Munch]EAZ2022986.1 hypothetical protein [Salmonella enterica]ECV9084121.1 hypothetical protein [Salmonella enterica subsp. enterica serovar Infantis]MCP0435778.1 hypothetical protein [Salmonella enterica subsp. enterica serovar Mbandaka]QCW18884.1 hypothetical protein 7t3_0363 [Salmonella phage 7t3]QIG62841.1 hypothetical protein SEPL_228 [Salmonella phage SE_PL]WNV47306.1 hypothetical protein [Klebsiella phage fENko-Kae01]